MNNGKLHDGRGSGRGPVIMGCTTPGREVSLAKALQARAKFKTSAGPAARVADSWAVFGSTDMSRHQDVRMHEGRAPGVIEECCYVNNFPGEPPRSLR